LNRRMILVAGAVLLALGAATASLAVPGRAEQPLVALLAGTHVHGLAVDPADPDRLLIATHHGLHALTLSTGRTEQISRHSDDLMGFTPHPDDGTLFASGHPAGGGNLGFIVSEDGGATWTMRSPGLHGPVDFHAMTVSPADPSVIYGAYGGLQVSRDGGATWEMAGPTPEGLIALAASPADTDRLYAATEAGLRVSEDAGRSWQPAHPARAPVSSVTVARDGTVLAFVLDGGLQRATEPDLAWESVAADTGGHILLHLVRDPDDPLRLFAASHTGGILASADGGATWSSL
jgi:photosystem II stability/assembly factor-like uncharacterized protein